MQNTVHKRPPPHHFTFKQSAACGHFSPSLGRIMDATWNKLCVCACVYVLAMLGCYWASDLGSIVEAER